MAAESVTDDKGLVEEGNRSTREGVASSTVLDTKASAAISSENDKNQEHKGPGPRGGNTPITQRSRPGTPVPFYRSPDGRHTPLSHRRISSEGHAQSPPRSMAATPLPPISTLSHDTASDDGRRTPSDLSGFRTPPTHKIPVQGVSNMSSNDSIRRKPVPALSYDNLRDLATTAEERVSTPRNPLDKIMVSVLPDQLREKAPSTPDSAPRTHVMLPGQTKARRKAELKKLARLWWVEGVCCSVSLLCIIIIFAVLAAYDDYPIRDLPLNLNALLAFFTTVATAAFLLPVSESVSQWKWNYFRADTRSLDDFQLFDAASRSPHGAAALLANLRHTHPASAGAAVLLLALMVPAVSQVAVGHTQDIVVAGNGAVASVSVTEVLPGDVLAGLGAAVEGGVAAGAETVNISLPTKCHTGQCDFEPFEGLGVCAEVHDVSGRLAVVARGASGGGNGTTSGNGTAPGGVGDFRTSTPPNSYNASLSREANCRLMTESALNILTCKTNGSATLSFEGDVARAAIYSMPVIYSNYAEGSGDDYEVEFGALEVLFHLCLKTYSVSVRGGRPEFKTVRTSAVLASGSADREVGVECEMASPGGPEGMAECFSSGDIPSSAFMRLEGPDAREGEDGGDPVEAAAHFGALEQIALAIGEGVSGLWMREERDDVKASVVGTLQMDDISRVMYDGDKAGQKDRLTRMARNIATSLTNAISARQSTSNTSPGVLAITGTPLLSQSVIHINYAALAPLVLLFAASLSFVVLTAVLTDRDPGAEVLKSSALAALFALEEECRGVAGGVENVQCMESKARVMHVRLRDEAIVLAGEAGQHMREAGKGEC